MKSVILTLSLMTSIASAEPQRLWSLEGFSHPESIVAVPGKSQYLVSNIVGHPAEQDGVGTISLVSASGKWINKQWAVGLDAPKGMAISGDKLFVSDLTALRVLSLEDGTLLDTLIHPEARFLNDVTADSAGTVYISDMMSGAIYRYADGEITRWLELEDIPHPNGLFYNSGTLLLASWGQGMHDDFSTDIKGGLFTVDIETRTVTPMDKAQSFANLDTVENTEHGIITNDWLTGDVYRVSNGTPQVLFNAGVTASDFGIDGKRLLVPVMMEDRIDVYLLP
jgi:sugar lactone lactonase YvrE